MNAIDTSSQQVSFYETHKFLEALLAQANVGPLCWAGTPGWVAMPDSDPRKLLALAAFGVHHALRVEVAQTASAEASSAISAALDWSAVAREQLRHANAVERGAFIPRRTS